MRQGERGISALGNPNTSFLHQHPREMRNFISLSLFRDPQKRENFSLDFWELRPSEGTENRNGSLGSFFLCCVMIAQLDLVIHGNQTFENSVSPFGHDSFLGHTVIPNSSINVGLSLIISMRR